MTDSFVRRSGRLFVRVFMLGFGLGTALCIFLLIYTQGKEPEGLCERVTDGTGHLPLDPYEVEGIEYSCRLVWSNEAIGQYIVYSIVFMILIYLLISLWKFRKLF